MFDSWEQRREKVTAAAGKGPLKFVSGAELMAMEFPPSSEERLDALAADSWSPKVFDGATRKFLEASGFITSVHRKGDALPALKAGVIIKYAEEYEDYVEEIAKRDDLVVAILREGDRVIGFASAEIKKTGSEVKLLSVDQFSTRERGVQQVIELGGESFGVGIAHVLIQQLLATLPRPLMTDATSPQSRYVMKSFGFTHRPKTKNPCLLQSKLPPIN